jgi:hypothetical protein
VVETSCLVTHDQDVLVVAIVLLLVFVVMSVSADCKTLRFAVLRVDSVGTDELSRLAGAAYLCGSLVAPGVVIRGRSDPSSARPFDRQGRFRGRL